MSLMDSLAARTARYLTRSQLKKMERIREDEKIEAHMHMLQQEKKASQIAEWTQALEEKSEHKNLMKKVEEMKDELKFGNKALVKVRKAQLSKLLESEDKQHETELSKLGLTIYKDRL